MEGRNSLQFVQFLTLKRPRFSNIHKGPRGGGNHPRYLTRNKFQLICPRKKCIEILILMYIKMLLLFTELKNINFPRNSRTFKKVCIYAILRNLSKFGNNLYYGYGKNFRQMFLDGPHSVKYCRYQGYEYRFIYVTHI